MSRSPIKNDFLPPIRSVYEESYGSPRVDSGQIVPYQRINFHNDKVSELEYRLDIQERTSQQLVDRAIQIKQDLIENLNFTQGTWLQEKEARELLQEHIRTITAVVRQMNKDIKTIDSQLKEKENVMVGTGNALRHIENNQLSSIGEIRSRIGRCDSISAKLANDIRQLGDSIKVMGSELNQSSSKLVDRLQTIELKNHDISNKMERMNVESTANIRLSVDETSRQLIELDNRTKIAFDDLKHQVGSYNSYCQSEREKLETKILSSLDKSFISYDSRIIKLEEIINSDRPYRNILNRLESFENDYKNFRRDRISFEKDFEKRMTDYCDRLYVQQVDDLSRFKREVRDSFAAIYETVTVMQSMVERKQKLSEDNLRKEISQFRKMVVLN